MSATRQYKQPFNFSTIVMSEEDVATVMLPDSWFLFYETMWWTEKQLFTVAGWLQSSMQTQLSVCLEGQRQVNRGRPYTQ